MLLLALGLPTTRKIDTTGWGGSELCVLRVLNSGYHEQWLEEIGFVSDRKNAAVAEKSSQQSARYDHVPVTRALIDRVAPENTRFRKLLLMGLSRTGSVSRRLASEVFEATGDAELGHLLGFFYDEVATVELGEEELTLRLTQGATDFLVDHGYDEHFGARPLKRAIQKYVEDPLSEKILVGEFQRGDEIEVDVAADKARLGFRALSGSKA